MKRALMFALFWCLHLSLFAQRQRIDSLLGAWSKGLHDTMDMRVSYQLGKDYLHISGDSSMWFANRALRLTIKYKDEDRQANCYAILGANEKNRGNYERALDYHLKAMRIKENEDDTPSLAITLNDIGVVYKIMGRLDQALGYYRKSNLLCVAIGLGKGIAMTYNNIGTIFREKRMLDSALYYYELGLRQAEKMDDGYSIATCLTNLGDVYAEKGKNQEALLMFLRCLDYDKQNEDKSGLTQSYNNIARALNGLRQYQHALTYSDSAIAVSAEAKLELERLQAYGVRMSIEENLGRFDRALDFSRKVLALKDSLMNEETNRQVSELQTRYETEKKERQIALQQSEITKKNYLITGVTGLLALSGLLSWSSYNRYRLRQTARLQEAIIREQEAATHAVIEAEERERKRIAADLHDGVGQLMSAAKMNLSMVESELAFQNPEQKQAFEKAMSLVDEGCREVRSVSHQIMPNALLKSGLASAVREFINKIDQRVIKVNLYAEGLNERVDSLTEPVLYRVIQECVNNVIKHAAASQLDISVIRDGEGISVTIEDNGKGFNPGDKALAEGIGLKNIRSRVEYLKGTVEWDSSPGKGTVVMVHVPV